MRADILCVSALSKCIMLNGIPKEPFRSRVCKFDKTKVFHIRFDGPDERVQIMVKALPRRATLVLPGVSGVDEDSKRDFEWKQHAMVLRV